MFQRYSNEIIAEVKKSLASPLNSGDLKSWMAAIRLCY